MTTHQSLPIPSRRIRIHWSAPAIDQINSGSVREAQQRLRDLLSLPIPQGYQWHAYRHQCIIRALHQLYQALNEHNESIIHIEPYIELGPNQLGACDVLPD